MRDIHCHILPGVDDGPADLEGSLAMLESARLVGIDSIVCTPHARDPYFNYEDMLEAFELLAPYAQKKGIDLRMGWEVYYYMLLDLGMDWARRLCFDGSSEFLLELPDYAERHHFREFERTIFKLQGMGFQVIIAHPERCIEIQKDIELARDLVRADCKLQASADFLQGSRLGRKSLRCAKRLFTEGLYSYIASDAHRPSHYLSFAKALRMYQIPESSD